VIAYIRILTIHLASFIVLWVGAEVARACAPGEINASRHLIIWLIIAFFTFAIGVLGLREALSTSQMILKVVSATSLFIVIAPIGFAIYQLFKQISI